MPAPDRPSRIGHQELMPPHYRRDIDGLRAIAILVVIAFHAFPRNFPGGFVGVDIFFVISGYLISSIILRGLLHETFSFLDFYMRRVKRIFPALVVVLLATWAIGWLVLLPDEYQLLAAHSIAGACFALNLFLYADLGLYFGVTTQPLLHLWSLGVEEQFYIVWPLFLFAIHTLSKRALIPIIVLAISSFSINIATYISDPLAAYYLPFSRFWELAAGGTLAYAEVYKHGITVHRSAMEIRKVERGVRWQQGSLWALSGLAFVICSVVYTTSYRFPGWQGLIPVAGSMLLIATGQTGLIKRILTLPAMVFVGKISYPLYLWHLPILAYIRIVAADQFSNPLAMVAIALSFAAATMTYKLVELPLRSNSHHLQVAAPLFAVMLACVVISYMGFIKAIPPRAIGNVERFYLAATADFKPLPISQWLQIDRLFELGSGPERVLFIGDSNMLQYYERIEKTLADHPDNPRSAIFATRGACVLGAVDLEMNPSAIQLGCRELMHKGLDRARQPDVRMIVVGLSWYLYFESWSDWNHFGEARPIRPSFYSTLEILRKQLSQLTMAGKRVYLILQMPVGARLDPRQIIKRTILPPGFAPAVHQLSHADAMNAIEPINALLRELAGSTGAIVIDPASSLCNDSVCPATDYAGEPIYYDANHLRPSYVREHIRYLDEILLATKAIRHETDGSD